MARASPVCEWTIRLLVVDLCSLCASGLLQETGGAVASYPRATVDAIGCECATDGAMLDVTVSARE